ncbi:MAG: class I SAM-dependent methyltransferase [Bacteroidales bacterium]|nr:class I SAM-dependent methyltransferase [Bacteroidales bacterium]
MKIKSLYHFLSPKFQSIHIEYKVNPRPRFSPHSLMYELINKNRVEYKELLQSFLEYTNNIQIIKDKKCEPNEELPTWNNGYLSGLDIVTLYGMIAQFTPKKYIEIGSGNSTKVVYKSVQENNLQTKIISIDPMPRTNIDHLADTIIRKPIENLENISFILKTLDKNDILFIDNSHRVFSNSDAMVCFMEILPMLKKGVIVHFHDIYLPYDYPQFMCDRFYNEQYVLASFLMANPEKYKTILPNFFISEDDKLSAIIAPIWEHENLKKVEKHGGSFWLKINQ